MRSARISIRGHRHRSRHVRPGRYSQVRQVVQAQIDKPNPLEQSTGLSRGAGDIALGPEWLPSAGLDMELVCHVSFANERLPE
jgi:hypothetical protein